MQITEELHGRMLSTMETLRRDRLPWWNMWREIADYYIPKRYVWLLSPQERTKYLTKNGNILDATGTTAGRVLAAGMMNGITSPSRPWFKLRIAGFGDDIDDEARIWLDECERRMLLAFGESNFYNAMAIMYLDLVFFGTAATLIYEDAESVFRCYNNALGEYYLGQSSRLQVNCFAREFNYKVRQVVERWGIENCSDRVKALWEQKGGSLQHDVTIIHLIEPNDQNDKLVPKTFPFREVYWEQGVTQGTVLSIRGFHELPGIFPRWELTGNDSYGTSPGMDALGDVIQLQHETRRKGQALDYMIRPPMVMDIQLQHRPTALLPGGQTFVAGTNNVGAKPAYEVRPPLQELTLDIREIQARIREIFNNDLFRMISQLDTVRSATEIDARREEKLIQLGPVLERFENEALDPAINRVFNIMLRAGLLPPAPQTLADAHIEIQYVSILSAAQSAVGVIPTERFLQLVGNLTAVFPEAKNIPQVEELLRDYARDIGVKARGVRSREEVQQMNEAEQQALAAQTATESAVPAAQAAKLLSETDVGGGANALQQIVGG
jgi:hypothetical protein